MSQSTKFDPRLAPLTLQVKSEAHPQPVYHQKAAEVRADRDGNVVTLYRHDDILKINRHPAIMGNGGAGPAMGSNAPLIPLEIDGEEHRLWRKVLDPMFAPKKIAFLEDQIRMLSRELLAEFASTGRAELHDAFCVPLPCLTFLRLLGAPAEKLDFFIEFKDGVVHPEGEDIDTMTANMLTAAAKIDEFFVVFLAERKAEKGIAPDIISTLLHSEVDGRPITDDEMLNVMFLMMFAGLDTVTSSMSCIFAWLAQHPEERDMLAADPSLIPSAIEEIMRFESPVPSGQRYAQEEIDLGDGLVINKGDVIHAIWAAANLDPNAFTDPLRVDLNRGRTNHIVFASGTHRCLGSHLARLELRIALEELLAAIPDYTLDLDEPLKFDNQSVRCAQKLPVKFTPS